MRKDTGCNFFHSGVVSDRTRATNGSHLGHTQDTASSEQLSTNSLLSCGQTIQCAVRPRPVRHGLFGSVVCRVNQVPNESGEKWSAYLLHAVTNAAFSVHDGCKKTQKATTKHDRQVMKRPTHIDSLPPQCLSFRRDCFTNVGQLTNVLNKLEF